MWTIFQLQISVLFVMHVRALTSMNAKSTLAREFFQDFSFLTIESIVYVLRILHCFGWLAYFLFLSYSGKLDTASLTYELTISVFFLYMSYIYIFSWESRISTKFFSKNMFWNGKVVLFILSRHNVLYSKCAYKEKTHTALTITNCCRTTTTPITKPSKLVLYDNVITWRIHFDTWSVCAILCLWYTTCEIWCFFWVEVEQVKHWCLYIFLWKNRLLYKTIYL